MTDELSVLLEEFPGSVNRTHCFTHILNLVAKSILKQFDVPKTKAGEDSDRLTNIQDKMSEEEVNDLDKKLQSVQLVLTKVSVAS